MNKLCPKCNILKSHNDFGKHSRNKDGLRYICKSCKQKENKEARQRYKNQNKCLRCGKVLCAKICNECYQDKQTDIYKKYKKQYNKIYVRLQYDKNNIQFKLSRSLRSRLRSALKNNQKTGSAVKDLGCSIDELKTYLENQFQPGMTWKNWGSGEGRWNIDHIKPLFMFDLSDRKQLLDACHYTNLRPLWWIDNMARQYEEFNECAV